MYDHMHRAIADRRLPPGTKLVEEGLAEIFEVSRARVRKVLQRLAHDKMVTLEPPTGAPSWRGPRPTRRATSSRRAASSRTPSFGRRQAV